MLRNLFALTLAAVATSPALAQLQVVERVSVSSSGAQGAKGTGSHVEMSDDGRYVAFASMSSRLVPGDSNGTFDVFRHDRQTGVTIRCSVRSAGTQGFKASNSPSISGDGRFVAFSTANGLVPVDLNGTYDIYLHDAQTGVTELVSVDPTGGPGNSLSTSPELNADGSIVGFQSTATDLVPGDTNGHSDVFVRDRNAGVTTLVSITPGGVQGNGGSSIVKLNAAGNLVLFNSDATSLSAADSSTNKTVYLADLTAGTLEPVSKDHLGFVTGTYSYGCDLTDDGTEVAFSCTTSGLTPVTVPYDEYVFVRNRATGTTTLASLNSRGQPAHGDVANLTGDGRYISWRTTTRAIGLPKSSPDYDVSAVRDRKAGVTELVSCTSTGSYAQGQVLELPAVISHDGRYVAYASAAPNLVPGDTNDSRDVFVVDRRRGGMELDLQGSTAGGPLRILVDGGPPSSLAALLWSVGPPQITGSAFGLLAMPPNPPYLLLGTDALGSLDVTVPLPPSFAGVDLWVQGIDLVTDLLSNPRLVQVQ